MARPDILAAINYSANDLVELYGDTGHAAAAMVGIPYGKGVSKNRDYRTAQRNLQRYLKGRKPTPDMQRRMNQAGAKAQPGGVTGVFDGTIKVNGYERVRTIEWKYPDAEWRELLDVAAMGDEQAVWDWIAQDYGNGRIDSLEVTDGTIDFL